MSKYRISGVPIVETLENRKLVGIITNRDMRFVTDYHMPIADVMTKRQLSDCPSRYLSKKMQKRFFAKT